MSAGATKPAQCGRKRGTLLFALLMAQFRPSKENDRGNQFSTVSFSTFIISPIVGEDHQQHPETFRVQIRILPSRDSQFAKDKNKEKCMSMTETWSFCDHDLGSLRNFSLTLEFSSRDEHLPEGSHLHGGCRRWCPRVNFRMWSLSPV